MQVRITRRIPTTSLEGFDVANYHRRGVYEVGRSLCEILFAYGYAEPEEGIAVTLPPGPAPLEEPTEKPRRGARSNRDRLPRVR